MLQSLKEEEMTDILEWLVTAEDPRQQRKMRDIIVIVFFAELANANKWIETYLFALMNEAILRKYLPCPTGYHPETR